MLKQLKTKNRKNFSALCLVLKLQETNYTLIDCNWIRYFSSKTLLLHEWSSIAFDIPTSLSLNWEVFLIEFTSFALETGKTAFILLLNRSLIWGSKKTYSYPKWLGLCIRSYSFRVHRETTWELLCDKINLCQ